METNPGAAIGQTGSAKESVLPAAAPTPDPGRGPKSAPSSDWGAPLFVGGIWALLLLAALAFGWKYGSPLPWWEEWYLIVPVMTGEQPVTASWLWLGEGEHRIPLPKLVWLALLRLGGYDFRAGLYFNVFALGLLALSMILAARALRGWTSYADSFFPIALLHWGQWPNLLLLMQVHQVLPIFLAGTLLVLIARSRTPLPGGTAVLAGTCLILLPLCGSVGLVYVPLLSLWLGYSGVLAWRSSQPHGRRNGLLMLAFALAGLTLLRLYFVGWKPNDPIRERTLWATLTTATQFLSLSFGPASRALWPYSGLAVLGLALFSVAALVLVWRRRPQERFRTVGLLLFMGASACLALAVGWGRNEGVADARYVTFGVPMLCGVYFIWMVHGGPSGRLAQTCLFTLMCAVFSLNTLDGVENGRRLHEANAALERDLLAGTPASVLAQRHYKEEGPIWCVGEDQPAAMMRRLRQRGIGLFRYLPSVEGALEPGDGNQISGWAWDADRPATPVRVDIYADETLLATVAADQARDGLREAGVGDGRHGFSFPVPDSLKDGKAHAVRVEVAGTGHPLARTEDEPYRQLVYRIRQVARAKLPPGATVLVVSDGDGALRKLGEQRRGWHFPRDAEGNHDGQPADSADAIARLEALRAQGAGYLLLPEPSFWWLDYYKEFAAYLKGHAQRVHRDADCIIYQLVGP
jgi:hypothetical protein